MQILYAISKDSFTKVHQQEYDKILKFIIMTRQTIKHKLRHVYRGEIEWSSKKKHVKDVNKLWEQLRKYRKKKGHRQMY